MAKLYGPESVLASKRVTVDEDGSTSVLCSAVGNPAPNVTWFKRDEFNNGREVLAWGINEARLPIQYASRADTGFYFCLAYNVVATSNPIKTAVVVTQAPEPPGYEDGLSEMEFRWWANLGGTGSLECTVGAAPAPNFRWSIDGERVLFNSRKYFIRRPKLLDDLDMWSSVLEVRNITATDYKTYICQATNSRGTYTANHTLGPPVPPSEPQSLNVSNVMGSTAILSWLPADKGTSPSGYSLKYRPQTGNKYTFIDVVGRNITSASIQGLTPGTSYEVMIQSFNDQGRSPFALPPTHFTVPGVEEEVASSSSQPRVPRLTLLLMSLTGAALLVLNISIIICFFKRFTKMRQTSNTYKACYTPASTPGITTDEEDRTGSSDTVSSPSHYQMVCQASQRRDEEGEEEEEDTTLTVHHINPGMPASLKPPDNPILASSSLEKIPPASSPCRNYNSALLNGGLNMQRGRSSTPNPETICNENLKETIVEWNQEATQHLDDNISRRMKVSGHQPDIPDVCPKTSGSSSSAMARRLSMDMTCLEDDRLSVASHYSNTSYVNLHDQVQRLGRNATVSQRHKDNSSPPLALMPSTPVRVPSGHDLSIKCSMTDKMQQHEASSAAPPCCANKPTSQVIYHGQPHIQQQHEQQQYQEYIHHLEQHHHHHHHPLDHQHQQPEHSQPTAYHQHDHYHHVESEHLQDSQQHLAQICQTDYQYLHPNYGLQRSESHQEIQLHQRKPDEKQEMLPPYCSNAETQDCYHQMPYCDDLNHPSHRVSKYYDYTPIPQTYSPQPPERSVTPSSLYRSHSLPRKKSSYSPSPQRHHSTHQRRAQFPFSYDQYLTHSRKGSHDPYGSITHSQSEHQYPVPFTEEEYSHGVQRPTEEYPLRPIRKDVRHDIPRYSELDPSSLYAEELPCPEGRRGKETTFGE
ncbi:uncharacterized protein [Palaemon carinicauda]|uniref:uncharacterized protein n=1 Tax=Palaemon carinicauda TaxID=392227 RepID=UPI0035B681B0